MIDVIFENDKYIVRRVRYYTATWCDVNFIDINECEIPEDKIIEIRSFDNFDDVLKYLEELGIEDIY